MAYNFNSRELPLATRDRIGKLQNAIWQLQKAEALIQDADITSKLSALIKTIEKEMDTLYGN